jgi:AraC-like DNA-binding protein
VSASPSPLVISSRIVCRIVDAAAERGVDPLALCREAGVDPAAVRDVDAQIDIARYLRLWQTAAERVGAPDFPIAVAGTWQRTHNLLRFVCISSRDLGEAMERASRYLGVVTNAVSWPLEHRGDVTVLAMHREGGTSPATRYAEEFGVAEIVTLARAFTGEDVDPVTVRFTFERPPKTAAQEAFFRAPLAFGAPRCEVHFSAGTLRLPLLKADAATVQFFESYLEKLLSAGAAPYAERSITNDVRGLLVDRLRGTAPTIDDIAAALGTSGRTLRRRLSDEGQTFTGLLDEVRLTLAKEHIERRTMSLAELSYMLGFSEPSAFHRAFRRWTGSTPQGYARRARVGS